MSTATRPLTTTADSPSTVERLPERLSGDYIESRAGQFAQPDVSLDITPFKGSRLFAEARLLGVLGVRKQLGKSLTLRINSDLPPYDEQNDYWKFFLRTLTGYILAQYSTSILDRTSGDKLSAIQSYQASALCRSEGLIASGKEIAAPAIEGFGSPKRSRLIDATDIRYFTTSFKRLLFQHLNLPADIHDDDLNAVCDFAYETVQNSIEHGTCRLDDAPIIGALRYLLIRRVNLSQESLTHLAGNDTTPITQYLKALSQSLESDYAKPRSLIEITIADSGIGIPARMAGDMAVYDGHPLRERNYLADAIKANGTSKPSHFIGAGLGLYKTMRAACHLKGLIVFRTGRTFAYKHYLDDRPPWPSLQLYDWSEMSHPYLAGTAVSLLFPWINSQQLSFNAVP